MATSGITTDTKYTVLESKTTHFGGSFFFVTYYTLHIMTVYNYLLKKKRQEN